MMASTEKLAGQTVNKIISRQTFRYREWEGKKFSCFQFASTTEKGSIGEDCLGEMLQSLGYKNVDVVSGRRGHYDVRVQNDKRDVKFEVKTTTRDTGGNFQFNGMRYDTKYLHLFFFAITPNRMYYEIVPKSKIDAAGYKMVAMQKSTNATFKITRSESGLSGCKKFGIEVREPLGAPR